jgi:phage terminase Nu1 subunit (DNA packaging protein)
MARKQQSHAFIVTRVQFAALLACTPDRVSKYIAEGMPVLKTGAGRGRPTTIDLRAALPWILQRRSGALDAERGRYFRLQADRVQQDIRHRAGELVEGADVDQRWSTMVAAARERLLSLPSTALQRHLITPDAEDALIGLVDELLEELSGRGHAERA